MHQKILGRLKSLNKNQILISISALSIVVAGVLILSSFNYGNALSFLGIGVSTEDIAKRSVDYLNEKVLQQDQKATLVSSSEESDVVKFTIKVADQTYDSYATKDGKLLFPQALTIDTKVTQ